MRTSLFRKPICFYRSRIGNFLFDSKIGLFKSNLNMLLQIRPFRWLPRPRSSSSKPASKHSSEKIANIAKSSEVKLSTISASKTSEIKASSSETSFPIHIILLPFLIVRKHLISLINLLKLFLWASTVRMILHSLLSKGLFYLICGSSFTHTQNLIIILFWIKIHFPLTTKLKT